MSNPIAVPGTVVPTGSLTNPSGAQGVQGIQGVPGSAYTGSQSVLLTGTNFTLSGDQATPPSGQFYGYSGGVKGWFTPPSATGTTYTGSQSVLLTGSNFTLGGDVTTPTNGQCYGYRNGARRWFQPNIFNVVDYGADPSGAGDSTAAITSTIAAMTNGGTCYFPAGTYKVSGAITINKSGIYVGDGPTATTITTTSTTADVFVLSVVNDVWITRMGFTSSVTRIAGYYVNGPGASYLGIWVTDFFMTNHFQGIHLNWQQGGIANGRTSGAVNNANTSTIIVDTGCNAVTITNCTIANGVGGTVFGSAIRISDNTGGDLMMHGCNLLYSTYAMLISIQAGLHAADLYVTSCDFDTCTYGLFCFSGSGPINRLTFTGCYFSNCSTNNVQFSTSGGSIDGVDFVNCGFFLCGGVCVNIGAGCKNIRIMDSKLSQNTGNVIVSASGVTNITIANNVIGPYGGLAGNNAFAIQYGGSNTYFFVIGNNLTGNISGETTGATPTSSVIANNL